MGSGDGSSKPKKGSTSIRMILMGPPGAGETRAAWERLHLKAYVSHRQGNTSTKDTRKILCLPPGMRSF